MPISDFSCLNLTIISPGANLSLRCCHWFLFSLSSCCSLFKDSLLMNSVKTASCIISKDVNLSFCAKFRNAFVDSPETCKIFLKAGFASEEPPSKANFEWRDLLLGLICFVIASSFSAAAASPPSSSSSTIWSTYSSEVVRFFNIDFCCWFVVPLLSSLLLWRLSYAASSGFKMLLFSSSSSAFW